MAKLNLRAIITVAVSYIHTNHEFTEELVCHTKNVIRPGMTKLKLSATVSEAARYIHTYKSWVQRRNYYDIQKKMIWFGMPKLKLPATVTVAASYIHTNYKVCIGISIPYKIILRPKMTRLKLPAILIEAASWGVAAQTRRYFPTSINGGKR